jgi:hypothetical protein
VTLRKGDRGPAVKVLQAQLLDLGYTLPRFGADGDLGSETLAAVNALLASHREALGVDLDEQVTAEEIALIDRLAQGPDVALPSGLFDATGAHEGKHRIRRRRWQDITGITLHQTATVIGDHLGRWPNVPIHLGVTRIGVAWLLNGLDWVTYHGNSFNSHDVGIEIDGHFSGIEGQPKTHWNPASLPNRAPLTPLEVQLQTARNVVRWVCEEVERHGGKVLYIHAHRQSSASRQSDPGSKVWQEVGLWAQRELGLSDGGPGHVVDSGLPIPEAWDSTRVGVKY